MCCVNLRKSPTVKAGVRRVQGSRYFFCRSSMSLASNSLQSLNIFIISSTSVSKRLCFFFSSTTYLAVPQDPKHDVHVESVHLGQIFQNVIHSIPIFMPYMSGQIKNIALLCKFCMKHSNNTRQDI